MSQKKIKKKRLLPWVGARGRHKGNDVGQGAKYSRLRLFYVIDDDVFGKFFVVKKY